MVEKPTPSSDGARLAAELLDRRRVAQARDVLRDALAQAPDDAELLLQSARADAIDDDNHSARSTLGRLLEATPEHLGARLLLLALLTDDGDLPEAERIALGLLKEYPAWPDLYAAYARVMLRALHLRKARELTVEGLRLDPDNESALRALALCDVIELRRATDSQALRKLLAEHPEDQHTLALTIAALANAGQERAALRGAQQLLRAQPDNPEWLRLTHELRMQTHWSLLPLWPLHRYGWTASIALWIGAIVLIQVVSRTYPQATSAVSFAVLGYVAYSWVWPPLLRRWLMRG